MKRNSNDDEKAEEDELDEETDNDDLGASVEGLQASCSLVATA